MKRFRLYIDESGDHTYHDLGNPAKRYLGLTGVAVETEFYRTRFHPDVEGLKQRHFPHSPDEPIIFHRKELINRHGVFGILADPKQNEAFTADLIAFLAAQEYWVFTVVIDKKAHSERYGKAAPHPYHHCLTVLLERYREFLSEDGDHGDVMAESRGGAEDMELKRVYREVFEAGLNHVSAASFQEVFTSRELKLKRKTANIAGLQVADLLAYPIKQDILAKGGVAGVTCGFFGERLCLAVKVKQNSNGRTLL